MNGKNPEVLTPPKTIIELPAEVALKYAITTAHYIHAHDPDLVREGAKHHGVKVSEEPLLHAVEDHSYNFRVPHGNRQDKELKAMRQRELESIMHAEHIVVGCMDYRQSDAIAKRHQGKNTIFFFTAGGCVQPTDDRFSADVRFVTIAAMASGADVDLYYHTGVCGGANHFTDGKMKHIHEEQGLTGEIAAMDPYAIGFAQELIEFGIEPNRIQLHRVDINDQNAVVGVTDMPIPARQSQPPSGLK